MDSPHISLIFVNYRSIYELRLALKALFSFEDEKNLFEVVVVNNDPSEQAALESLKNKFPLRLYALPSNVGFGAAANFGVNQAKGEIVGFFNPDTQWQRKILREIAEFFKKQEDILLGLSLFDENGRPERFSRGQAPSLWRLVRDNIFPREENSVAPLDWVSGGALFVLKKSFLKLSGFDERFFLYFEDVDLCVRAKKAGFSVVSADGFAVLHRGGRSFASRKIQKKHFYASQVRYYAKHRPFFETWLVRCLHLIFQKGQV